MALPTAVRDDKFLYLSLDNKMGTHDKYNWYNGTAKQRNSAK